MGNRLFVCEGGGQGLMSKNKILTLTIIFNHHGQKNYLGISRNINFYRILLFNS